LSATGASTSGASAECEAVIADFCRTLRMPTLGRVWPRAAEAAQKEKRSYAEFLRSLLEEEVENRTV